MNCVIILQLADLKGTFIMWSTLIITSSTYIHILKDWNLPVPAQTNIPQQGSSVSFSWHMGSSIFFPLLKRGCWHLSLQFIVPFSQIQTVSQSVSTLSPSLYVKPPLLQEPAIKPLWSFSENRRFEPIFFEMTNVVYTQTLVILKRIHVV